MRRILPLVLLAACATDGDLYGGGNGLTLVFDEPGGGEITMSWPGAEKSDLREVNGGLGDSETTWDPVTVGAQHDTWTVRADDAFDGNNHLFELGIDCGSLTEQFTAFANEDMFGFEAVTYDGEYIRVAAPIPDGDAGLFEGSAEAATQWAGDLESCGTSAGDLSTSFSVSWTLDEEVTVPNKCLECALPSFELDIPINIEL